MKFSHPEALHIVGAKNSGKTRLTCYLVEKLCAGGYTVGTYKHSSHEHPLDKPDSDSDRHRRAGALPAAFATKQGTAIFLNGSYDTTQSWLARLYAPCDVVLVESFRDAEGPKILIDTGRAEDSLLEGIIAVVNPQRNDWNVPVFKESDSELVQFIEDWLNQYR